MNQEIKNSQNYKSLMKVKQTNIERLKDMMGSMRVHKQEEAAAKEHMMDAIQAKLREIKFIRQIQILQTFEQTLRNLKPITQIFTKPEFQIDRCSEVSLEQQ